MLPPAPAPEAFGEAKSPSQRGRPGRRSEAGVHWFLQSLRSDASGGSETALQARAGWAPHVSGEGTLSGHPPPRAPSCPRPGPGLAWVPERGRRVCRFGRRQLHRKRHPSQLTPTGSQEAALCGGGAPASNMRNQGPSAVSNLDRAPEAAGTDLNGLSSVPRECPHPAPHDGSAPYCSPLLALGWPWYMPMEHRGPGRVFRTAALPLRGL